MKNEFFVCDNEVFIKLKTRKPEIYYWTIIDLVDLPKAERFTGTWYRSSYSEKSSTYYVLGERRSKGKFRLHRRILGMKNFPNLEPDHKDGNGLNNKRDNLQVVSASLNIFKRGYPRKNKDDIVGVYYNSSAKKWEANITINWKRLYLGKYKDKTEAIAARLQAEDAYIWSQI